MPLSRSIECEERPTSRSSGRKPPDRAVPPLIGSSVQRPRDPCEVLKMSSAAIDTTCPRCGYTRQPSDLAPEWQCPTCGVAYAKADRPSLQERKERFILTTETTLQGYEITERIEVISAECVFGMNIFRDFFSGITDMVGGRSVATQKVLRDARRTCLEELKKEAISLGADAVIGIDLDYSEFSGGGKSMLFLVATGTAVRIQRESKRE